MRSSIAALAVGIIAFALAGTARAQNEYGPPELIEAAKKEGKVVFYTANVTETEQEWIKSFNKRFPFVKLEIVRAPGGQLITRIVSEAAAGKLLADVVDLSDRGIFEKNEGVFADYRPPNAADYPEQTVTLGKGWPRTSAGWIIAYNSALLKEAPPKGWADLKKPIYGKGVIGEVIALSGGTTWNRIMFERLVLGEDYWAEVAKNSPSLYPSNAPLSDAVVRGEVQIAPLLANTIIPKQKEGAPIEIVIPPEGVPVVTFASGITKTAPNPNAGRLFLNWSLSAEGQKASIALANFSVLKNAPPFEGADPSKIKIWLADHVKYEPMRNAWIDEWNKVNNYRQ